MLSPYAQTIREEWGETKVLPYSSEKYEAVVVGAKAILDAYNSKKSLWSRMANMALIAFGQVDLSAARFMFPEMPIVIDIAEDDG